MIGAVLREIGNDLTIENINLPNLIYGQVLVEIHSSGICGRQIQEIMGYKGEDKFLPHLLGHEGGGIVKAVGLGVSKCKVGDHVVLHWRKSKGIESNFPTYHNENGKIGGGLVTTFNSEAIISENRLTVIPKSVNFDVASLLGCAVTTALGLINNEANAKIGESILIIGSGSVGLSLVQASTLVSCFPIVAADISDQKINKAIELGASNAINMKNDTNILNEETKKIVGKNGFDIVVDTTGIPNMIDLGYNILTSNGRLIMVGQPKNGEKIVLNSASDNFKGKKIFDSQGGETNPDIDIKNYIKIIENNKIDIKKIITKRINIKDINSAIGDIKNNKIVGKCIINF
jgi:S-(hydroxymethyl)glutathione dehydrogenase / alcohol dehydrogenase